MRQATIFTVREASISIFHLDLRENDGIRFGWLFWISTFLVPIIYLARGIQKKDALLLRIGLLLIPAIVLTVRYYHHILPVEITMTLGGAFMIGCAYLLLKYLRQPKCGFTNEAPAEKKQGKIHQLEALAIAQTFGQAKPDPRYHDHYQIIWWRIWWRKWCGQRVLKKQIPTRL